MASLFLSAAHKSSGKTTLSIGLCAALKQRGLRVQPFKKGPDYIDPIWLGMAAGNPCYNLDFFVAGRQETIDDYCHRGRDADICIIEGNKGLYDGLDLDGSNSNAALAKAIASPVILVIDVRGTMRGIAPLLIGYQVFDEDVNIAGVIANMTGGSRHESKLRAAVEEYTSIPFLGALGNDASLALGERHLGLIPGYEDPDSMRRIATITDAVRGNIDLDRLLDMSQQATAVAAATSPLRQKPEFRGLRIGIARDRAFGFYYPGDLDAFAQAGARLVPIDTINDRGLPEIDGLFIGGGFPERHAADLAANVNLRDAIRNAIEAGLPAYAECGGLMYLSQNLSWNGVTHDMVGVLPAQTLMHEKPQGRGYVRLDEIDGQHPWLSRGQAAQTLRAHEFHYSSLQALPAGCRFAYQMRRGAGIQQQQDGLVYRNLLASYTHLRNTAANPWVKRFLKFVQASKLASTDGIANAL
ncbi:MAG: cobyrinate a,c-diamide synthase [Gammaproteobacteria bacterium]|nr:cobyrinate a,c-diamide synthase [Gammaproteobacteria bacterium]MDH3535417.1 cobyrinate a,c-diamide synthase [Gammaproteobacteria bacterium]